jgi:small-conductance mechanosensitive channel
VLNSSIAIIVISVQLVGGAASSQQEADYFQADSINPALGQPGESGALGTPQACLEFFLEAARQEDWQRAAHALNFRLLRPVTPEEAAERAKQLHYLLQHNLWIDWSLLPDRPDGVVSGSAITANNPLAGEPRRSILLGSISIDGRDIPIRVERINPANRAPMWLFAAHSVDNVDRLYAIHGPSWLAERVPEWLRFHLAWNIPIWQWLALVFLIGMASGVGWLLAHKFSRALHDKLPGRAAILMQEVRWPSAIFFAILAAYLSARTLITLPAPVAKVGHPLLFTALVLCTVWLVVRGLSFFIHHIVQQVAAADFDDTSVDERGTIAQLTIARYALVVLTIVVGLSILLLSMDMFRTLGIALLSSAGAAAVLIGIAGHAVLGNLIMGFQIAIARPFRIGDTVFIENNWGTIEELRYTYVVVRTWDFRRLIFPVRYFSTHWFANWSKTDPFLVKPIYLNVDYRADVQAIRDQFLRLVQNDDDWAGDRDDPEVLVTEFNEDTMTVRLTCGGSTPSDAWYLSCRIREQMIDWLQHYEDGRYLPRRRLEIDKDHRRRPTSADEEHDGSNGVGSDESEHVGRMGTPDY